MEWLEDRLVIAVTDSIGDMDVRQLRKTIRRYREVYQAEDSTHKEKMVSLYYINMIRRLLQKLPRH